ncbi:alpha/beta hydrolase family protein [Actinokineospora auranticolor]|uniref:Alpha/beta hydrolase family protein n=1 Tax=Actinokineospora auranticolor TaxID=155976 RepID=A0A2S6GT18_9PSEU|nr:alpha/beta hydrolase family protein [Actinokineospora auranticolor]
MVLASLVTSVPAQAAPKPPPQPTWTTCPPDPDGNPVDPRLRCAKVTVPLDYADRHSPTIDIAVSRLATAKPGLRRGILVHNAGGPGGASLNLPSSYVQIYPQEVVDRYDLVSFDPRGIGYSAPVTCGRTREQLPVAKVAPFPAADGSIDGNITFARDLARDCLAHGGRELPYITTANTARDLDRVRIALGERKISYNSGSYGSYLGAVYASLYPDRTDRFVLDSLVGPGSVWRAQWRLWDRAAERRFTDFVTWAAANDPTLGTTADTIRANMFALADRLDREPVVIPGFGPVDGNTFRYIYFAASYYTAVFPAFAGIWHFLEGNGEPPQLFPPVDVPGIPQDNALAGQLAVICGDVRSSHDIDYYRRAVREDRARYPLLGGMGANIQPCAFWPGPKEPPAPITDRGPGNILLVQNLRDPATPYEGALDLRRALGHRAKLMTVNGGNHIVYSPVVPSCGVTAVNRYLSTGTLPDHDLSCDLDPTPPTTKRTRPALPGERFPFQGS